MPGTSFNGRYVARLAAADLVGRTDLEGFANFTPTGDGRVNIDRLREDFAETGKAYRAFLKSEGVKTLYTSPMTIEIYVS